MQCILLNDVGVESFPWELQFSPFTHTDQLFIPSIEEYSDSREN